MKKLFLFLNLSALCFLIAACGPMYKTTYNYIPPHSNHGRMCLNQCLDIQNNCREVCNNHKDQCKAMAQRRAEADFWAYQRAQRDTHQPIMKTTSDFYNDMGCQESCHCNEQYNQCYINCGGQIVPTQTCVAFCDKVKQ